MSANTILFPLQGFFVLRGGILAEIFTLITEQLLGIECQIVTWPLIFLKSGSRQTCLKPVLACLFHDPSATIYKPAHLYLFISFTFQVFWRTELFVAITILEKAISFSVLVVEYIYFDNGHHWFVVVCCVAEHVPVQCFIKSIWVSVT